MNRPAVLDPVPLVFPDDSSAIRVAGMRLTLDAIVRAFKRGATAEEIAQDYSPVSLPDVYAVIAYYLRHRSEVEEYLAKRAHVHAELRREIERTWLPGAPSRPGSESLRAWWLAPTTETRWPI